ncbi:hypothetical protein [Tenacibaculum amylolyticum]|uniref:hypothetical protein n=1 Tax=Tenacibaculum amylolyticum TaxID=104269 RepID=UPI003895EBEA
MKQNTQKIKASILVFIGFSLLLFGSLVLNSFRKSSLDLYSALPVFIQAIPLFVLKIIAVVCITTGFFILLKGKKLFKTTLDLEKFNTDTPFVLYLRPFDFDEDDQIKNIGGISHTGFEVKKTIESQISSAFKKVGKVISISNPKLDLQVLGSTKYKANQDNWKESVEQLIRESQIVVVTLGTSDSIIWEIITCLRVKEPREILFINPLFEERYDIKRGFFQQLLEILNNRNIDVNIDVESLSSEENTALVTINENNKMYTSKASFLSRLTESMVNQTIRADVINWLEINNYQTKSRLKKMYEWIFFVFFILMTLVCFWAFYMAFTE